MRNYVNELKEWTSLVGWGIFGSLCFAAFYVAMAIAAPFLLIILICGAIGMMVGERK